MNDMKQFFGAYFHQDWNLDVSNPDEVIRLFIDDGHSTSELINLAEDIEKYAANKIDDAAAEEGLLKELGCYYIPNADGIGARAWLNHVAKLLRAACESMGAIVSRN